MSMVLQPEVQENAKGIKCPINLKWTCDKDYAISVETENCIVSVIIGIPGFGDFKYFMYFYGDEEIGYGLYFVFLFDNIKIRFPTNLEFRYSFENILDLKKRVSGMFGNIRENENKYDKQDFPFFAEDENIFDISELLIDDQLTVTVEGYVINEEFYFERLALAYSSIKNYDEIIPDTTDFIVVAENKIINTSKNVLKARSNFFAKMFESNWKETLENRIEIPEFSFKIAEIDFNAICSVKNPKEIPRLEKMEYFELYQFADKYDIDILKVDLTIKQKFLIVNIFAGKDKKFN